jgi:hypothetical protein
VGIASCVAYNDCKGKGKETSTVGAFHPTLRALRLNQTWVGGSVHTWDRDIVANFPSSAKMDEFWL